MILGVVIFASSHIFTKLGVDSSLSLDWGGSLSLGGLEEKVVSFSTLLSEVA